MQPNELAGPRYDASAAIPPETGEEADVESADYGVGLLFREYDLDRDGRAEFMTATQFDAPTTGTLQKKPLFYWIDLNADAGYDQVRIDQGGEGRCEDIVLYQGPVQGRALLPLYSELVPAKSVYRNRMGEEHGFQYCKACRMRERNSPDET